MTCAAHHCANPRTFETYCYYHRQSKLARMRFWVRMAWYDLFVMRPWATGRGRFVFEVPNGD
jgi:hypothetical protein